MVSAVGICAYKWKHIAIQLLCIHSPSQYKNQHTSLLKIRPEPYTNKGSVYSRADQPLIYRSYTYIVDCESKGTCVTGLRWGVRKSTQEVETSQTPAGGSMVHCITAIWHSRIHIIPAEYHTGCVGLWKVRVCSM